MIKITILATISILATTAVFAMAGAMTLASVQAQPPMDNATIGNMTLNGGNMTDDNSTDAVGSVSTIEEPFAPG